MSMVDDLRSMLIAHGIEASSYTDGMLDSFILEAKLLVNEPFMFDTVHEDYDPDFSGDVFMTSDYPVLPEGLTVTVGGEVINPTHISSEGLIYFEKAYKGVLNCTYTVGLTSDDIQSYLLPMVVSMVQEKEGMNVASINEGDVSISYDNTTGLNTQVTQLIQSLKNKYSGRAVFI